MAETSNRSLWIAIAVSALIHAAFLFFVSGSRVSSENATVLPPLSARLAPLPKPGLSSAVQQKRPVLGDAPMPRPKPKPRKPVRPAEPQPASGPVAQLPEQAETGSGEAAAADKAVAETTKPPEPPSQVAEKSRADHKEGSAGPQGIPIGDWWASSGKVQYNVIRGDRNFIIGRTIHAWTHDDTHYSMETVIETSGLVGLIKPFRMVQRSEGRIGPRGLLPDKFTVERDGQLKERAEFDWSTAKVIMVAGERQREFSIAEGDQDVLSLAHQLSFDPESLKKAELLVVSGKSATRSVIENLGMEELDIPAGKVSAYHLASSGQRGELKIDIWLAKDYGNLPVRLKITDKNGDVLDQVATGVDLGPRGADRK